MRDADNDNECVKAIAISQTNTINANSLAPSLETVPFNYTLISIQYNFI